MSDEEDTAILLGNERTSVEKDIKIKPTLNTYNSENVQKTTTFDVHLKLSSIAIFTSGVCFGYDLTILGYAIVWDLISNTFYLPCSHQLHTIYVWLIGAVLSGIFGGFIIDVCGRKWSILSSTFLLIFSSILSSVSTSYLIFLCSRLLSGFSGSLLTTSQSIYASETSCPKSRGFKISLQYLGSSFGSLLACIVGLYIGLDLKSWKIALGSTSIPAFVTMIITLIWLPTSPHFKLYQRTQSSKKSTNYSATILIETFIIAIFLIIFQQLSGRYAVFFYASRLFSLLGICSSQDALIAAITFPVVKFLSTFLCLYIVDRLGRRTSLIMSSTIMMTAIAFLALLASMDDSENSHSSHTKCRLILPDSVGFLATSCTENWNTENSKTSVTLPKNPPPYPMLPTPLSLISSKLGNCFETEITSSLSPELRVIAVVTVLLYEAAYALGFGTLTWVLLSEIFPASIRGRGMSSLTCLHWLFDFIVPSTFTKIGLTLGSTFLIYSFICMVSVLFTFFMIPETKGKTLHQIAQEMRNISLPTRIFQNLQALPFFSHNQWLQQRAQQYRQQNKPVAKSTNI